MGPKIQKGLLILHGLLLDICKKLNLCSSICYRSKSKYYYGNILKTNTPPLPLANTRNGQIERRSYHIVNVFLNPNPTSFLISLKPLLTMVSLLVFILVTWAFLTFNSSPIFSVASWT